MVINNIWVMMLPFFRRVGLLEIFTGIGICSAPMGQTWINITEKQGV
jgi:hypothetical protein